MLDMEIWEFAHEYILEEKLFIVPTRAIGLLMINDMAKKEIGRASCRERV